MTDFDEIFIQKSQSMLFKRQSVKNLRYMASLTKHLTESGISGWWPVIKKTTWLHDIKIAWLHSFGYITTY